MGKIVSYKHHGKKVFVDSDLKGKHREHCLCWTCRDFEPNSRTENCPIANLNFAMDVAFGLTTPVYECPKYGKK